MKKEKRKKNKAELAKQLGGKDPGPQPSAVAKRTKRRKWEKITGSYVAISKGQTELEARARVAENSEEKRRRRKRAGKRRRRGEKGERKATEKEDERSGGVGERKPNAVTKTENSKETAEEYGHNCGATGLARRELGGRKEKGMAQHGRRKDKDKAAKKR